MKTTPAITDGAMIAAKDEESTVFFSTSNVAQLKWDTDTRLRTSL